MLIRFKTWFSLRARNQPAKTTACHRNVTLCKPKMQICDHKIKILSEYFYRLGFGQRRSVQLFLFHTYLINFLVLVAPEAEWLDRERDGLCRPLEGVQTCQVPKLNPARTSTVPTESHTLPWNMLLH
jgi:hypothetical protein